MDKHFDYCILRKDKGTANVTLFNKNNTVNHFLLTETAIRDVNVDIDDNGILYITGKEDVYEIALHERIKVDDLDSRPEEKFIRKSKVCHVWSSSWPIYRKESQSSRRNVI